jgi:hypothetical protein
MLDLSPPSDGDLRIPGFTFHVSFPFPSCPLCLSFLLARFSFLCALQNACIGRWHDSDWGNSMYYILFEPSMYNLAESSYNRMPFDNFAH